MSSKVVYLKRLKFRMGNKAFSGLCKEAETTITQLEEHRDKLNKIIDSINAEVSSASESSLEELLTLKSRLSTLQLIITPIIENKKEVSDDDHQKGTLTTTIAFRLFPETKIFTDLKNERKAKSRARQRHNKLSKFVPIDSTSSILHSSFNQADLKIFNPLNAGRQCTAMNLVAITRSEVLDPELWNTQIIDENMLSGDHLYSTISARLPHLTDSNGYLSVADFAVLNGQLNLFGLEFEIRIALDPSIYGNMNDEMNIAGFGFSIRQGLLELFAHHSAGMLIVNSYAYGVFRKAGVFYFFDPHSTGAEGEPFEANGSAAIIKATTIEALSAIVKRVGAQKNVAYTLDFIDINEISSEEAAKRCKI